MKLRNKKTGEIVEATDFNIISEYNSLAELNEDWEDMPEEETKEFWFVDSAGEVQDTTYITNYDKTNLRKFGNYFDTKEEAEKAVEKLEALAEAKDDGLKIKGYYSNHEDLVILADIGKCNKLTLDTLFGNEID